MIMHDRCECAPDLTPPHTQSLFLTCASATDRQARLPWPRKTSFPAAESNDHDHSLLPPTNRFLFFKPKNITKKDTALFFPFYTFRDNKLQPSLF